MTLCRHEDLLGTSKTAARASADAMLCQTPPHAVTRRALLRACLAGSTLQTLVGCRTTQLPSFHEPPSDGVTMYLIAAGWHTEIALPIHAIHGPLRVLTSDCPGSIPCVRLG
jgi:hypothetical protein